MRRARARRREGSRRRRRGGAVGRARAAAVAEPGRRRGLRGMLCKLSQCSCAKALSFIFFMDLAHRIEGQPDPSPPLRPPSKADVAVIQLE